MIKQNFNNMIMIMIDFKKLMPVYYVFDWLNDIYKSSSIYDHS